MSLSVLIVNWNAKNYLKECLKSLFASSNDLINQIIVVDSASEDGCREMLATEFPSVEFLQLEENKGFAFANNAGFKLVRCEKLLLINPDTLVMPGAILALCESLDNLYKAGIVAPRILNSDGSLQTSCVQAFMTPLNQALDSEFIRKVFPKSKLWGNYAAFKASDPIEVEAVSGACMLLKSDTYMRLGGFREEYFMYAEDVDLCLRLRNLGLKTYHIPEAKVVHYGQGSSRKQISYFSTIVMRSANEKYINKNYGKKNAIFYRRLQFISGIIRLGVLFPYFLFTIFMGKEKRIMASESIKKWLLIIRWTLGKINAEDFINGVNNKYIKSRM